MLCAAFWSCYELCVVTRPIKDFSAPSGMRRWIPRKIN
jgi:hypothetical protein